METKDVVLSMQKNKFKFLAYYLCRMHKVAISFHLVNASDQRPVPFQVLPAECLGEI